MRNKMKRTDEIMRKEKKKLSGRSRMNDRGMGTVEMILIIVVLIGLVLIFKTQITDLVGTVFDKIAVDSSSILS